MLKEVIFSGFGGQGALLIGQVLAMAGVIEDLNATYRPTYGFEKRGGVAFCDVILSDEEIGTPVIENPEVAVIMFAMYCYVGKLDISDMNIGRDEVEKTFLVPIPWLMEHPPEIHYTDLVQEAADNFPYEKVNSPGSYKWRRGKVPVPIYGNSGEPIWGMTGRITNNFIKILKGEK